ncbi:MAG: hypothetical protein K2X86_13515, partial [Cytophagaceae bacterium]|nr:hypothetical protein [Cytophagaceae bacterium]
MNRFLFYFLIFSSCFTLFNCSDPASEKNKEVFKSSPTDPFKDNLPQSEFFDISAKKDNVVEGKNGTLIVIPKGCFKNGKGETVENVKVELAEALSLDDMILSNLTTTSNGEMLETGGMVYINATSNGEQVFIDKANPLYIEIPTENKKAGMMAYKGIRDEKGNMNWIDPKPLENYLVPVDFSLLNFYPEGFEAEVQNGMPFRKYKVATKELTDSLYYSLSVPQTNLPANVSTDYNEPYYNLNKKIKDGKYTKDSYVTAQVPPAPMADSASACSDCGIDPAIIKTIKSKKFQNTFLATKEFEARLKVIFKTCRNDILEIYINNLDKNLWEADELAYKASGNDSLSDEFKK